MSAVMNAVVGGVAGLLLKPFKSKPKQPVAQPIATRNEAREAAMRSDALTKRAGYAANIATGSAGAEAPRGAAKVLLGT
jgi:hypothetical protein